MRRKISVGLILAMILNLLSAFMTSMPISTTIVASAAPGRLKVLCIGSSFGVNSVQHIYQIAQNLGATDIVVGVAWRTAATVDVHWQQASGNLPGYEYKKNTTGSFTVRQNQTMLAAIQDEDWDYIVFQQGAEKAADAGSYTESSITNVVNYINENKTNPNAKVGWNAVWSFNAGAVPVNYYNDQETMYYYIINAVKSKILTNPLLEFVVSPGTAIQNARSSYIGPSAFNADSMHLNSLGSYVAGMAWVKKLTGWSIDNLTWAPSGVPAEYIPVIKQAVNAAVADPYKVTKSSYTPAPDPSATATPVPVPTPTPGPDGRIIIPLIKDNFETYADMTDATNAGWQFGGSGSPSLKATAPPQYHQYLSLAGGGTAYKTFRPVPVNYHGGPSPGKNAKLVVTYEGYMGTATGASQAYFKVDSASTGYAAVSAGRRGGGAIRYSRSIPADFTGLTIISSLPRFTKLKFVIKLTDANGEFYDVAFTKVDVYAGNMETPIVDGADIRMIDPYTKTVDRFYMGGTQATDVDNIDISLIVDSDNMPSTTPSPAPTQNPSVNKTALYNKLLEAQNLYALANAHIGTGPGQYPPAFVAALSAAIGTAEAVYNNPSATQGQVDAQIPLLQAAINQCVHLPTSPPTPTPVPTATPTPTPVPTATPVPVDKVELEKMLFEGQSLYDYASANIGYGAGQFDPAVVSALYSAIVAGQAVYNNPSATQQQVDAAVDALVTAKANCVENPAGPTQNPNVDITTIWEDNFESYTGIASMQAAGWTVNLDTSTTPPGTPVLVTTAAPANLQYLRTIASTSAIKTFAPVALREAGGASPGKNAKVVVSFDAYTAGGTGSSQAYWRFSDSATGNVAVAAGRRAGQGSNIRYAKTIPATFTGITISTGLTRFTKIKFVIKVTDETGAFLAGGPKVDIYCSDMETPITGGTNVNMIDTATTKIDTFYIGGSFTMEADNVNISLITDREAPAVTTVFSDNFENYTDIASMQAAGWTVNLDTSTTPPGTPVLATTAAPANLEYLRTVASTSATKTFAPVALQASGGASPGKNAKLTIVYDAFAGGGTGSSQAYWRFSDSATGNVAVAAGRRAGQGSNIRYAKSIPSAFSGITISTGLTRFTKIKFVIKITDGTGAFLAGGPKVDIYCSDMETPIAGGTNVNMIDTATAKIDTFYIGGSFTMEIDNLDITLTAEA